MINLFGDDTIPTDKIKENIRTLFRNERGLYFKTFNEIVWRYLEVFCGVEGSITENEFYKIPSLNSFLRRLQEVKAEMQA